MNKEEMKNEIMKACEFRFACKEFDENKKIVKEDFDFLLEVARYSPSSFGIEPWKFLVIQNGELKKELLPACYGGQKQVTTCSHFVIVLARKKEDTIYNSKYIDNLLREVKHLPTEELVKDFVDTYGGYQKSINLFESDRTIFDWACKQTYIALGNIMSAAAQIGIDSCAMEGFTKDEIEDILEENDLISREEFGVSCLVTFGYRKNEPPFPKTRNPIDKIVKFIN